MKEKIIVAMDFPTGREALALAEKLRGLVGVFKIGLELFISEGPSLVRAFRNEGHGVFLDLKLHDIPNTVVRSVEAALALDVRMLTLHTSGGGAMMAAAAKARQAAQARTILLGVTVLTSLDDSDLEKIGLRPPVSEQVERLAGLASESGLDGLVCSPHEAGMLKKKVCWPPPRARNARHPSTRSSDRRPKTDHDTEGSFFSGSRLSSSGPPNHRRPRSRGSGEVIQQPRVAG